MRFSLNRPASVLFRSFAGSILAVLVFSVQGCSSGPTVRPWLTEKLSEEFTADMWGNEVRSFDDYLALEQRLFRQLDEEVYSRTPTGSAHALERYSRGSAADPSRWPTNWNRTFEFDPYKYNSFATNAATQVHRITTDVDRRINALVQDRANTASFPPVLVLKSTVDSTVTTEAVVDNLLMRLPARRNELVLFDINRNAAIQSTFLVSDPAPLTRRLVDDDGLPFSVTFVTNRNPETTEVMARRKPPYSAGTPAGDEHLDLAWPRGVISLFHVALPFPPDDPLYGRNYPKNSDKIYLGYLSIKGERGMLNVPADWLLRLRHNPFYAFLEKRVLARISKDSHRATEDRVTF